MEDAQEEEEEGGTLAEVTIPRFDSSKPTHFMGNVITADGGRSLLLQFVEDGVRVADPTQSNSQSYSRFVV